MIKINELKAELYERCSSIETQINKNKKFIKIVSVDSLPLREVTYTHEDELRMALIAGVLNIYLTDNIIIDDRLIKIFRKNLLLGDKEGRGNTPSSWKDIDIFYSDMIVNTLIKEGYQDNLRKGSTYFKK